MADHEMNVRNMTWRPRLVRLTCIANPDVDEGRPTPTYCDPQDISTIRRTTGGYMTASSYGKPREEQCFHALVACTEVHCGHTILFVEESPEEVARLRDKAFGHEPPKPPPPINVDNLLGRAPKP
jgi:hypothetical protein